MNKKLEVELCLNDIKEYVQSTLYYFEHENNKKIDKQEIIMYLSTVPEAIDNIKQLLIEIELEYENKIASSMYRADLYNYKLSTYSNSEDNHE